MKLEIKSYQKNSFSVSRLKILHITNFNERFDGRLHYNTSKRLNNGFYKKWAQCLNNER